MREAELAPMEYLELAINLIPQEHDEVTAQGVLSRTQAAFNRYLSDAQRREIAPRLEQMLTRRMVNAESAGLRITNFRAFEGVASASSSSSSLRRRSSSSGTRATVFMKVSRWPGAHIA